MRGRRCAIPLLVALLLAVTPRPGSAEGSWLDGGQAPWNAPGMAVPAAPAPLAVGSPQCQDLVRPAETAEDAEVTARGWRLYSAYQRGWGITLVGGFLNFDAMCRPVPYQQFVFVDGEFAGTLAPEAMVPRTDGALTDAHVSGADRLYAVYDRYAPSDPLCCPSGEAVVTFTVERTPAGPVVTPDLEPARATSATPASAEEPAGAATGPVGVGLGGDALSLVYRTADEIAAQEEPIDGEAMRRGRVVSPTGLADAVSRWLGRQRRGSCSSIGPMAWEQRVAARSNGTGAPERREVGSGGPDPGALVEPWPIVRPR